MDVPQKKYPEDRKFDEEEFLRKHPDFYKILREECPALTAHQLLICAMIREGLLSHEIGNNLKVTERTVESHRRDIRNKLGLHKDELTGFLAAI
jgi:DNA-binding NarL/FixJ family response regulator